MSFGSLSAIQKSIIRPYVFGKRLVDLGSGDLSLSSALMDIGANQVTAVDRTVPKKVPRGVVRHECLFHNFLDTLDVAFISWPINLDVGLTDVVKRHPIVIYLGTNVHGTACGDRRLWEHLTQREILAYEPDPRNTLIVYGPSMLVRVPKNEEAAGLDQNRIYRFEEFDPIVF